MADNNNLITSFDFVSLVRKGLTSNGLAAPDISWVGGILLVWILSSDDPQPVYERGIWYEDGIWLDTARWYG